MSPLLSPIGVQNMQRVVGSFLYDARAINNTIHPALNDIGSQQSKPTQNTNNDADILMDYLHTHPNAKLRFHKSDIQLHIDSDAVYLVAPRAKSRVTGYYYMSNKQENIQQGEQPQHNAPIHVECVLLKHVVSSSAEAEIGALFHNTKMTIFIIKMLESLGHKQDKVHIKTDNSTAQAFSNSVLKEKRSKTWDMRWWWLQDKTKSNQFKIY